MTNMLIRKLISCGFEPDQAQNICFAHINDSSLSVLEEKLKKMEKRKDVDKIQSQSHRSKCG